MLNVIEAKYIKDYQIEVSFNDNLKGIVDLRNIIENDHRAIFQELRNKSKFSQIKVDMDTVVWENGLDLAPEFLHELLINKNN
jgi:hypothetical protein